MELTTRLQTHQDQFMSSFNVSEQIKRREAYAVELRRQSRSRQVERKRVAVHGDDTTQVDSEGRPRPEGHLTACLPGLSQPFPLTQKLSLLTELIQKCQCNLETEQALRWLRRLFTDTSLGQLCHKDLLSAVIGCCRQAGGLQLEASWALANLTASSSSLELLLDEMSLLRELLQSLDLRVSENILYVLGNMLSSGAGFIDQTVKHRLYLEVTYLLLRHRTVKTILKPACWVLSLLLRHRLDITVVRAILEALASLKENTSKMIQSRLLNAVYEVSRRDDPFLLLLFQLDLIRPILLRLPELKDNELISGLCICVNISAGDTQCTQKLLDLSVLDLLFPLLSHKSNNVRGRALESLSNVAYGSSEQILYLIQHPVFAVALDILQDGSFILRSEATTLVRNVCIKGEQIHLERILDMRIFARIRPLLEQNESGILKVASTQNLLEVIKSLLSFGRVHCDPRYWMEFEQSNCKEQLEHLQYHSNSSISDLALSLLESWEC